MKYMKENITPTPDIPAQAGICSCSSSTLLHAIIFLFALFYCSCSSQNTNEKDIGCPAEKDKNQLSTYILNPNPKDSLCIKEIEKAKEDIANGRIVVSIPMGFGTHLRQEKQLRELCEAYNLYFDYNLISDVVFEGQTQGCYGEYMDKCIADKFGAQFKQKLLNQADSILIASNDTIPYFLCDKQPQIPETNETDITLYVTLDQKLSQQVKPNEEGAPLFMDIGFYIDKKGDASNYFIGYFFNKEKNEHIRDQLFHEGVALLKQYKHWEPGEIKEKKVLTENNVRVYFDLSK